MCEVLEMSPRQAMRRFFGGEWRGAKPDELEKFSHHIP
jgi:hypothetical protein